MIRTLAGFFASLCCSLPALAWNAEGHMVVAQLAYNHLDAAAKNKCDTLIAVPLQYGSSQNNTFVTAAVWADDYKNSLGTGIWHYIDLPFSLDGTSTDGVGAAAFDVVLAIEQCVATLQDGNATQTDQATSLRYLLHFVGDIQQPLHCSTAVWSSKPGGDAGGNGFNINGTWSNLHSLWDAGGGFLTNSPSRPLSLASQNILNNKVALAESHYPYVPNLGVIPDPMDWAIEGEMLAQTICYTGITRGTTPTTNYLNTTQATTEQRMAAGGQRLANLLNTLFGMTPFRLSPAALPNNNVSFSWNTSPGLTNRVQWKQQLTDTTWNNLTNFVTTGNSASFTEAAGQTQRFYRVVQ